MNKNPEVIFKLCEFDSLDRAWELVREWQAETHAEEAMRAAAGRCICEELLQVSAIAFPEWQLRFRALRLTLASRDVWRLWTARKRAILHPPELMWHLTEARGEKDPEIADSHLHKARALVPSSRQVAYLTAEILGDEIDALRYNRDPLWDPTRRHLTGRMLKEVLGCINYPSRFCSDILWQLSELQGCECLLAEWIIPRLADCLLPEDYLPKDCFGNDPSSLAETLFCCLSRARAAQAIDIFSENHGMSPALDIKQAMRDLAARLPEDGPHRCILAAKVSEDPDEKISLLKEHLRLYPFDFMAWRFLGETLPEEDCETRICCFCCAAYLQNPDMDLDGDLQLHRYLYREFIRYGNLVGAKIERVYISMLLATQVTDEALSPYVDLLRNAPPVSVHEVAPWANHEMYRVFAREGMRRVGIERDHLPI